jgi:hypothetical protein
VTDKSRGFFYQGLILHVSDQLRVRVNPRIKRKSDLTKSEADVRRTLFATGFNKCFIFVIVSIFLVNMNCDLWNQILIFLFLAKRNITCHVTCLLSQDCVSRTCRRKQSDMDRYVNFWTSS